MFHLTFKKSSVSKKLIGKSSRFQELANTRCMRTERPGSKTLFKKQAQDRMEKPIITLLWAGPLLSSDPASKLSVSNNSGRIAPSSQAVENQVCISRAAWVGSSLLGINWVTCPHPFNLISGFLVSTDSTMFLLILLAGGAWVGWFSGRPDRIKATNYSLEKIQKEEIVWSVKCLMRRLRDVRSIPRTGVKKKAEHAGTHLWSQGWRGGERRLLQFTDWSPLSSKWRGKDPTS